MTPGFTTHKSSHGRKQKRALNTPVSPWEISDTYSTTNECNSKEHTRNLASADKISQDRSKELTLLGSDCTPKQIGGGFSDP